MSISSTPSSPSISGSSISSNATNISFCYTWTTKLKTRKTADGEATILSISPKFATVHQLISFQWNIRIHATSEVVSDLLEGFRVTNDDDEEVDYVAVDLYFVDGPVNEVNVMAEVGALEKTSTATLGSIPAGVKETKTTKMTKGVGCEITDADRECVSRYLKENVDNVIKISIIINMETRLFEPSTYLDAISPTPRASFLTANYNARVNSKVWKRRSKKRNGRVERRVLSDNEKTSYERKVQKILDEEREKLMERRELLKVEKEEDNGSRRASLISQFRENQHESALDDHMFKRILVSCCESCEQRRLSFMYDSRTEDDSEADEEEDGDDEEEEEEPHFECDKSDKEHVHDMLANLYFNKVVLPEMEYVEDFVDFLIDAELNDLPVLKRACERYLCSELNTKKDIGTCLLLDLLFNSIVFSLPVMKSMTLTELANRTHEFVEPDSLLEQEEYKNLDKRMRNLADRNLVEIIEQCVTFRDQKARVRVLPVAESFESNSFELIN
ncbi:hypothetical protein B9Z55_000487 [Caenorhabditis nigoni]|uniref:Uncharacterized protein n=2 Tax=Caenorhabditis nigoni TaxID=1611254 RepID=A0A2G5VTE4_9PELO|nr:hypothetical protein B9Z55_000487 [Caenorhabditis nigoni]